MYSPNLCFQISKPSIPPYPQETKSSNSSNVIVITAQQREHCIETYFFLLNDSESKCVKVVAYEIFIYDTDVSYLPLSEMGHMAMLHLN